MDINKSSTKKSAFSSKTQKKKSVENHSSINNREKTGSSDEANASKAAGNKKLEEIKSKINSNFYERKEILGKVADKILKKIKK